MIIIAIRGRRVGDSCWDRSHYHWSHHLLTINNNMIYCVGSSKNAIITKSATYTWKTVCTLTERGTFVREITFLGHFRARNYFLRAHCTNCRQHILCLKCNIRAIQVLCNIFACKFYTRTSSPLTFDCTFVTIVSQWITQTLRPKIWWASHLFSNNNSNPKKSFKKKKRKGAAWRWEGAAWRYETRAWRRAIPKTPRPNTELLSIQYSVRVVNHCDKILTFIDNALICVLESSVRYSWRWKSTGTTTYIDTYCVGTGWNYWVSDCEYWL